MAVAKTVGYCEEGLKKSGLIRFVWVRTKVVYLTPLIMEKGIGIKESLF